MINDMSNPLNIFPISLFLGPPTGGRLQQLITLFPLINIIYLNSKSGLEFNRKLPMNLGLMSNVNFM
jgi:hypothetical protein